MSNDYSAIAPIMPLQWTAPDVEFDKALEVMLADFVIKLAEDGVPMDEVEVEDLRLQTWSYRVKVRAEYVPGTKRLTDAELAAECHAATLAVYRRKVHGDGTPESIAQTTRTIDHMATVQRFATLPHYDEDQS